LFQEFGAWFQAFLTAQADSVPGHLAGMIVVELAEENKQFSPWDKTAGKG
jgi:hypothetical protein